jgi:hypothetical protein
MLRLLKVISGIVMSFLTIKGLLPYIVDTYKRYEGKEKSQTDKSRREWQKEELEVQSCFLLSTPFEQTSMSPTALGCEGEAPINSQPAGLQDPQHIQLQTQRVRKCQRGDLTLGPGRSKSLTGDERQIPNSQEFLEGLERTSGW